MAEPESEEITVCNVCRLPWADHLVAAGRRQDEALDEDGRSYVFEDHFSAPAPTHEDCVVLMKRERQGPQGPPGPMGMSGEPGRIAGTPAPPGRFVDPGPRSSRL